MSDNRTTNDLLITILEQQTELIGEFREHKGAIDTRVKTIEDGRRWEKVMTYAVNPALAILVAIAAHFGIKVGTHP